MLQLKKDVTRTAAFTPSVKIKFLDGTTVDVPERGIGPSNTELVDSAECSTLPIGIAICRSLKLELVNDTNQWDGKDFLGATVTLKLDYGDGDVVQFDDLTCTEPPQQMGLFISITCLDNMWRADKPYESDLTFPTSVGAIWREACNKCGIQNAVSDIPAFSVQAVQPLPAGTTYRQVFGYVAALAGGNARITPSGEITIVPWFIPDSDTDTSVHPVHILDNWITLTPALRSVVITGVAATVTVDGDDGESEQTITVGSDGYVLEMENPFINADNAAELLETIFSVIGGKEIRPYTGDTYFYPVAEAGDSVAVVSNTGAVYYSVLTDTSWRLGGRTSMQCSMAVPVSPGRQFVDPSLKALIAAKQLVSQERTAREQAIISLQTAMENASGLYKSEETLPSGAVVYYLHDKPTLAGSRNVIKLTNTAILFSTNGGVNYPYGFTVTGDMVARVLAANGLNADWINTGALSVQDDTGKLLFRADVAGGAVYIDGVTISDGVITLGYQDAQYYTTVADDGLTVYAKGQALAKLGSLESYLPQNTYIPNDGAIRVGEYRIYAVGDAFAIGV